MNAFGKLQWRFVVPYPSVRLDYLGIMSKRNTVGDFIADKTKPKETQYKAQNWSLKDWGGTWHSGTSEVPYLGYPKNFTPRQIL